MHEMAAMIKGLNIKSDFLAVSYTEWQTQQVKLKITNLVTRLKRYGEKQKKRALL
ncbi:MAG: hypothetical protein NVS1B13_04990 [Flavisolibacter sp.]